MTAADRIQKRCFDLFFAGAGLCLLWPIILVSLPLARYSTGASGVFRQQRIGLKGKEFTVYKLRTMMPSVAGNSTVTVSGDSRITRLGAFFRHTKIDELPQLWNVILGDMSIVGPRPDVAGYADTLVGDASRILLLRPGITGPATIKYSQEEKLLAESSDPELYNKLVIYPDKTKLNLEYHDTWSLYMDIRLIFMTIHMLPRSKKLLLPVSGENVVD